ncbi:uncharacterized protein PHACADRAFT_88732 [Phanerochaete carnosa HHB-10118-sp]|uniref:MYND-type domain-containing protein n=1 Tax=Phanerochaete carnosa (strain HHB-10118-sp) TaxID=650164 RepID=K5WH51_PHACS|nr:uncharacterized protein PHACADRAFT_88732 [Phanerochaete carnosa HHB-10118-sp]EKM58660.1 hypothetical protein PHACADRAFT_88732 [Phanerochaete carnosa HHB-10118-sp]
MYAQPAAANYYSSPSHPTPKQRGYRMCDSCGTIEQPNTRFRLCGGCMTTQYCSQECQKSHWASHKAICQHTSSQISTSKQHAMGTGIDEDVVRGLRKFTSAHSTLLGWAGFQALQLKRMPSNVRQQALLVELNYRPSSDSLRRFSVKATHLVPRTYVTDNDPLVGEDIRRREERCRKTGGIGTAVIIIQCGEISQVMPVEVDSPSKISWDSRDDWLDVLRHFVDTGRTDFKPVSTTSRG